MGSLVYTGTLVEKLKVEERENVQLWAEAIRLVSLADTSQNLDFFLTIIDNNNTVPVILTDEADSINGIRNFDVERIDDPAYLKKILKKIKEKNEPIKIDLEHGHYNLVYYKDSTVLTMLILYPYIQLGIILRSIVSLT